MPMIHGKQPILLVPSGSHRTADENEARGALLHLVCPSSPSQTAMVGFRRHLVYLTAYFRQTWWADDIGASARGSRTVTEIQ